MRLVPGSGFVATLGLNFKFCAIALALMIATEACWHTDEKSKRLIPGPSVKVLIPESNNKNEDRITQIILGELFKPGPTEYKRIGAAGLKDAPPLPNGYSLFKDLAYDVRTEAITAGHHI